MCVEFATGKAMWANREMSKVTPIFADGLLYCLNYEGTLYLVEPDPKRCVVVSSFALPAGDNTTWIAQPVIAGGRLYVRHGKDLFAYDLRSAGEGGAER